MTEQTSALPAFDGVGLAKELLRGTRSGSLATLDRETGVPFASLVTVATDHAGAPLLLLSRLAAHTLNLEQDPRASVLLARPGRGDPLAHPRLTVMGRVERSADPRIPSRFLARHPKAALYAGFADFSFWRLAPEHAHLNGGFARARSLTASELQTDLAGAEALLEGEGAALEELNGDAREALACLAMRLAGGPKGAWIATGLDPEGLDLAAGDRTARVRFPHPVLDLGGLRDTLASLLARARSEAAGPGAAPGT